jgi:hypothetical protein
MCGLGDDSLRGGALCFMVGTAPMAHLGVGGDYPKAPEQTVDGRDGPSSGWTRHCRERGWGGSPSAAAVSSPAPRLQRAGDRLPRLGWQAVSHPGRSGPPGTEHRRHHGYERQSTNHFGYHPHLSGCGDTSRGCSAGRGSTGSPGESFGPGADAPTHFQTPIPPPAGAPARSVRATPCRGLSEFRTT